MKLLNFEDLKSKYALIYYCKLSLSYLIFFDGKNFLC